MDPSSREKNKEFLRDLFVFSPEKKRRSEINPTTQMLRIYIGESLREIKRTSPVTVKPAVHGQLQLRQELYGHLQLHQKLKAHLQSRQIPKTKSKRAAGKNARMAGWKNRFYVT